MIDLGKLQLKIEANTKEAIDGIEKVGKAANDVTGKSSLLSKATSITRKAFLGLSAAATASYVAVKKYLGAISSEGDKIDKNSQKLGVTAEQYQALALATDHCGISMTVMTKGTTKAMDAGYDSIYDFLEELEKIPDSSERAAKAQEVLGTRAANELAPLLKSKEGISAYREELERLGYYSDEAIANSAAYQDAMTSLNQTMLIVKNVIAENVLPVVTELINKITDFVVNNKDKLKDFASTVGNVINFIVKHIKLIMGIIAGLGIASTILTIITSIGSLVTAISAITPVVTAVVGAMSALMFNPFTLIVAGVVAVIAAIALLNKNWDKIKATIQKGIKFVINSAPIQTAKSWIDKLTTAWKTVKSLVGKALTFTAKITGFETAINAFKTLKSWWDKIKGGGKTTFTATKKDGKRIGIREIPYDNYSTELHKGEVVLTAAEANQYKKMINNQDTWKYAGNTNNSANPSMVNVTLTVDSKVAAKILAPAVNNEIDILNSRKNRAKGVI